MVIIVSYATIVLMTTPKVIKQVRPPFRVVSPLVARIVLIYGTGNLFLGYGLITYKVQLLNLLTINRFTTYPVWGMIFILLGTLMLVEYYRNEWPMMRALLFVGVVIKTYWMIGLLARFFSGTTDNIIVPTIWLMITALQVVSYIYFYPPVPKKDTKNGKIT